MDSSATDHMINSASYGETMEARELLNFEVYTVNQEKRHKLKIKNVLFVADLKKNLLPLSVRRIESEGFKVAFKSGDWFGC